MDLPRTTLFCLHFLGGSARGWHAVLDRLPEYDGVPIDLPGFGAAAGRPGYAVAEMADHVARTIAAYAPERWILAGHSMGAKVAAVLARRAEDGDPALSGLAGLVLVAGSPPGPEPMDEGKRAEMLGWFAGDAEESRSQARGYVDDNTGTGLAPVLHDQVVDDVLAARREAWVAWLTSGSREDWADRVGVLQTPALVVTGGADGPLGADGQARLTLPHLADAEALDLPGCGHLVPQEDPAGLARLIAGRFAGPVPIPPAYLSLIRSSRVSTRTREVLLQRAEPAPRCDVLAPTERATLRAVVARVIPQAGPQRIDMVDRLAEQLDGEGDGWRPAELPPDREAWVLALRTLGTYGFAGLPEAEQDALLQRADKGTISGAIGGARMKAWFEELRAAAVRLHVSHPATMARMGYSGIAYGGDGPDKPGFTEIGIGQREGWEPA